MAQRTEVQLIDDLDGSPADETVAFGLDGQSYRIDLTAEHAEALRTSLARYVEHARRGGTTNGRRSSPTPTTASGAGATDREDPTEVREWARENGHDISSYGRIARSILEAFRAARGR